MSNLYKKKIDDLGRIVIPKQIRERYKIKDFDELDIYVENGNIVLKKNIGICQYKNKLDRFLVFFQNKTNYKIVILNNNNKVVSSNLDDDDVKEICVYLTDNEFKNNNVFICGNKFIYKDSIIFDSNYLGDILFVSLHDLNNCISECKSVKNIILDLII